MNEACKAADPEGAIFAASTAAWAIYAFLKTPSNFWRTIFACIEVGGKQALGNFSSRPQRQHHQQQQQQHQQQQQLQQLQHQSLFQQTLSLARGLHQTSNCIAGDTDTVAACAGGPAGAFVGLKGIESSRADAPSMLALLKDATQPGKLDLGGLRRLAGQLHAVVEGAVEVSAEIVEEARL
jgi:hypothetical protein